MSLLQHLPALERRLEAKGFTVTSPWWRATIERFYRSACRMIVLRVGRRGGKSSTLCRIAVLEALFGEHKIPFGDLGIIAIISVSRDEASQRLRTIRTILDALGIAWRPIDGGIELTDKPIAFKTFTASIAGVSGFTCIAAICDEVAKWRDADSGSNPASEVLASLRPTMATQKNARMFLSSSPLGSEDAHATAFDLGDSSFQIVAYAPSWEANPSITEEGTHALEPDLRIWSREYGAIPQAGVLSAFDPDAIDRAFARKVSGSASASAMVIDASSGRKDAWTWGLCRWVRPADAEIGRAVLEWGLVDGVEGAFWTQTKGEEIVAGLAGMAQRCGIYEVHADQREELMLASAFSRHGVELRPHPWTAATKPAAVATVRRWFADGTIALPPHEKLRRELLAFEERITASGSFTFGARGSGHDDYVSLLLTAAMADGEGMLDGSPVGGFSDYAAMMKAVGGSF